MIDTSVNPNDFDNTIREDISGLNENATLLSRIERLEKQVECLRNKPAEYVPPPLYGPIPMLQEGVPVIEFTSEDLDKFQHNDFGTHSRICECSFCKP